VTWLLVKKFDFLSELEIVSPEIKPKQKIAVITRKSEIVQRKASNITATDDEIKALLGSESSYERGFRLLMTTTQERLYWHIRQMVGTHDDADDVLQNTFVKAFRGLENFKGDAKFSTWLYRIATNESITFLGQRKRHAAAHSLDDEASFFASKLRADAYFDGDEIQLKLQIAIAQLPDKQRVVFNLRYFQEMPYEEMSGVLDTSVGALKASFHHAVKKVEAHFHGLDTTF
jgi:RNA polymerase sigma-70 factor, ECF subfamily